MSRPDETMTSWKGHINFIIRTHKNWLDGFTAVSMGVDRHGGIEWSWYRDYEGLDRYLILDIIPKGVADPFLPVRLELWGEAGNKALYARKMIFSRRVNAADVEGALKDEFSNAVDVLLSIDETDLDIAVGRPLWSRSADAPS